MNISHVLGYALPQIRIDIRNLHQRPFRNSKQGLHIMIPEGSNSSKLVVHPTMLLEVNHRPYASTSKPICLSNMQN